jgi:hypothetical protein
LQGPRIEAVAHALELFDSASPPLLLGVSSASAMLGLSPSAVQQMAVRNQLPDFRLPSGRYRFSRPALERWTASRERGQA